MDRAATAPIDAGTKAVPDEIPIGYVPREVYAALDLGTNNCRLLVARRAGRGFRVVDAFSRIVRLGEGVAQSGRLSQAAMDRTLAALAVCAEKMTRRKVTHARAVATEACRRAENCEQFLDRVRAETGIPIEIIASDEEARLVVVGCAPSGPARREPTSPPIEGAANARPYCQGANPSLPSINTASSGCVAITRALYNAVL